MIYLCTTYPTYYLQHKRITNNSPPLNDKSGQRLLTVAGPPASQPARPPSLLSIFHQISKRGLGGKSGRLSFPRTNRGCDAPSIGPTMSEDSNQTLITAGSHACSREGGGTHSWVPTPASFFPSLSFLPPYPRPPSTRAYPPAVRPQIGTFLLMRASGCTKQGAVTTHPHPCAFFAQKVAVPLSQV